MAGNFTFPEGKKQHFSHAHDGKTYIFGGDGSIKIDGVDKALTNAQKKTAHEAFTHGFEGFSATEKLADEQIKLVRKSHDALIADAAAAKALKPVTETFSSADRVAKALSDSKAKITAGSAEATTLVTEFRAQPNAENLLKTAEHQILHDAEKVELKAIRGTVGRIDGLHTALEELHKAGKYDEKAIKELVHKHGSDVLPHLDAEVHTTFGKGIKATKDAAGTAPIDFKKIAGEVTEEAAAHRATVQNLADDIVTLKGKTGYDFLGRRAKELEGKVAELKDLRTSKGHMDRVVHEVLDNHPEKALLNKVDGVKSIMGDVAKTAESVGGKAAKDGGIFTKKAADLVKYEAKQLEGVKGLWNKRNFAGKAALVGVPAVAIAYVAGIGGKGKHTEQVMQQSLDQGQGVGIA